MGKIWDVVRMPPMQGFDVIDLPFADLAPSENTKKILDNEIGNQYVFGVYAQDDLSQRTALDDMYVGLFRLDIDGGDGDEWPITLAGRTYAQIGSDLGGIMSVYGYAQLVDGGRCRQGMYGVTGYVRIDETDEPDTPDGYICGVLGIYNTPGVNPVVPWGTPGARAAVLAVVKDNANSLPDAAVLAFLEGDATATIVEAAFKALNARSAGASGFRYGLDLYNDPAAPGPSIAPAGYDVRLQGGGTFLENGTNQFECSIPAFFSGYIGSAGNPGISGALMFDDGANFRVELTFEDGLLVGQTVGASVAGGASWT